MPIPALLVHAQEFCLWPDSPPGSAHLSLTERVEHKPDGRVVKGIGQPTLTYFAPAHPHGGAVVIAPGGGYTQLMFDKEGVEYAQWLCRLGFAAFVLKHRLPAEGHQQGHLVALQDAQRAVRLLRVNADAFAIDPNRIGMVGVSSGGHLGASLAACFAETSYEPLDDADQCSARPDFLVAMYGPFTGNRLFTHTGHERAVFPEPEKNALYARFDTPRLIGASAPPTFLVVADDDAQVNPENCTALYLALHRAGVPVELHVFHDGGHGFALRAKPEHTVSAWPSACENWLSDQGFMSIPARPRPIA